MKKQNNNETNNNTGMNEAKSPKKKMKVSTIVIIALVVLLLFSCVGNMGGSDSSSSSTTTTSTTTEDKSSEKTAEETTEAEVEEQEPKEAEDEPTEDEAGLVADSEADRDNHIYVGDVIEYESGSTMTIEDVGIVKSTSEYPTQSYPAVYVSIEMYNGFDEAGYTSADEFSIYVDDYQEQTTYTTLSDEDEYRSFISLNPGRKGKITFGLILPDNYESADTIELGVPGSLRTILVKYNGEYVYGRLEAPVEEATVEEEHGIDESWYEEDHISLDGLDCVLAFEPDGWTDAIVIIKASDYDHQWRLFMEDDRNGYLTYMEGDDKVGSIYFGMSGIEFECDSNPEFNGLYW